MILSIVLCVAIACSVLFWYRRRIPVKVENITSQSIRYHDPVECKEVICGKNLLEDTFCGSASTLLESRAVPNERLIKAFNIDNAFTTTDMLYYREFLKQTKALLHRDEIGWQSLTDVVKKFVRQGTQRACNDGVLLVPLVQTISLKTSIYTFFEFAIDEVAEDTILLIAEKINILWIKSKRLDLASGLVCEDQKALRGALRKIFPNMEDTARGNPLNLILPAYETLWRIVLRCFIEVMFHSGKRGSTWHRLLLTFLSNPTQFNFEEKSLAAGGISVSMIITEALRLYPPTRRIYRQVTRRYAIEPEIVAADIEYLHRDPHFWGEDSLRFNPSRWKGIAKNSCYAYMPFGSTPYVCPAKRQFGPWMIGILVAALVAEFEKGWTWNARLQEDAIDYDEPLSLERDSYKTLKVLKHFKVKNNVPN